MLHIAFSRITLTPMFRRKKNDISNNCNATWTPSNERKEKPIQCLQITPTSSEWTQLCDVK